MWDFGQVCKISKSDLAFPRIINISEKSYLENQKIHFTSNNFFFENRAFYEIMWKNIVQPGRPQMAI